METGHTEEALKLMKSDIATSEILKDMLDEVDDVALKAYALDEKGNRTGDKVRMQDEGYLSRPFGRTGHKTSAAEMEIWKKSQNTKFLLEILVLHILK